MFPQNKKTMLKTIKGSYLWYSGVQTHAGFVKDTRKITDKNIKVSFSEGEKKDSFYTVSFTASQIEKLLKGEKVSNKNDGKDYQLYDSWKKSVKSK
jgi:hypothetical protein